jgi:hypothetical protein
MANEVKRYHAFLSYNSQDRPAVEDMERRLRAEGLTLYLELREIPPGREFQPALVEALRDSKTCVMFLGPSGLGPWQNEELQVAIDTRVRDRDFHVIPVLLPGAERPRRGQVAQLEFLINASWVEFLKTLDDPNEFRRLVWGITGKKPEGPAEFPYQDICPYRGLEAFRREHAKFFFGRESLTGWLVSALRREVRAPQGTRLLAVLGPSGSGKSSVVLAGLVPRLSEGAIEGGERWPVAILRPGDDPLQALTEKVVPALCREVRVDPSVSEFKEQQELLDSLRAAGHDAPNQLNRYAGLKFSDEPEGRRLLIVVDQFEEVFTYRPQDGPTRQQFEREREVFFASLLRAAAAPNGRVAVVLTMRSDFLSACAPFPQLSAVLSDHQELVGPMTPAELRNAIERPAYLVGCEVEPALTERLLADVKGQSGALPLLQFALTGVWKKRDVRRLTREAYIELGKDKNGQERGIEGVLDHRANEIYGTLTPEGQDHCRRLFLRLVQLGEGTEDTKRRVSFEELLPEDPARAEAVRKLIDTLSSRDARLITTEGNDTTKGVVEVAHEALIRGWTEFRKWVDADRAGLRTRDRLNEAVKEWQEAKPDDKEAFLYAGVRLAVVHEWAATHRDELSPNEVAFLTASEEAEQKRKQDALENERRLREAAEAAQEAERKRAEEAEAAAKRQKLLAEAVTESEKKAVEARKRAEELARIAESRRLAAEARSSLGSGHPQQALILAVEAVKATRDLGEPIVPATETTLHEVLSQVGGTSLSWHEGPIVALGFTPDGRLVTAGWDATARVWDLKNPAAEPLVLRGHESSILALEFAPDGRLVTASWFGDMARVWDLKNPAADPLVLRGHEGWIRALGFAPDGRLVTAGEDRTARVWDLNDPGAEPVVLRGHRSGIGALGFAPDGRLVTAGGDKTARVWDLSVPRLIRQAKVVVAGRDLTAEEWQRYFPGRPHRRTFP